MHQHAGDADLGTEVRSRSRVRIQISSLGASGRGRLFLAEKAAVALLDR
jgi:hypothetical protein